MRSKVRGRSGLVVAAVASILVAGAGPAVGDEPPEVPELHSRSPLPFPEDTPDQWLPPFGSPRAMAGRGSQEDPFPQYKAYRDLKEFELSPPGEEGKAEPFCTRQAGPYQEKLERYLKLRPVDGKQSASDCRAIQRFQADHAIEPRIGYAGPHTWGTAKLAHARQHPNLGGKCPVRTGRVACVDLSRQLMWVQEGRKVVFGPATIRSGKPGYATRTGLFSVGRRNAEHTSSLYEAPMPFAQFFSGGQAFHGRYRSIYYEPGSHGCVNLTYRDAERLWETLRAGDAVYVYGSKPAAPE
ncbi:L,D-transpeptidase [Streptomyces coryli]|uniref:L,D-transpeptidase n=1 Tax=Streptomyces coryli TaxID=1128680 RepID=UPI0030B8BAA1